MPQKSSTEKESALPRRVVLATKMAKIVKVLKAAKFAKVAITVGTLALSVFAYSFSLGVWFSVGFVLMLLIHEMGHVIAIRRKGMKASMPIFIPFLGAAIFAPDMGNRDDEAYVGYGGPLLGGTIAAVLMVSTIAASNSSETLRLVAYTALFINVFNLTPIRPLDGGRITQAVGPWFTYIGVLVLLAFTLILKAVGLLIIWILVLDDLPLSLRLRVITGWTIEAIMIVVMVKNLGLHQPWWLDTIDLALATLFNATRSVSLAANEDILASGRDNRPQLAGSRRLVWFTLYLGISIALVGLMIWSKGYLPHAATH